MNHWRFWQGCWSARSVVVVEVNGYTIEPGADLREANLDTENLDLNGGTVCFRKSKQA